MGTPKVENGRSRKAPDRLPTPAGGKPDCTFAITLPPSVNARLQERVARLDISVEEWVITVVIEALEHPDGKAPPVTAKG